MNENMEMSIAYPRLLQYIPGVYTVHPWKLTAGT